MEADVGGKAGAWLASGMNAASQDALAALAPTLAIARRLADASGPDGDLGRARPRRSPSSTPRARRALLPSATPRTRRTRVEHRGHRAGRRRPPRQGLLPLRRRGPRGNPRQVRGARRARAGAPRRGERVDPEDAVAKNKTPPRASSLWRRASLGAPHPRRAKDAERTYNKFASRRRASRPTPRVGGVGARISTPWETPSPARRTSRAPRRSSSRSTRSSATPPSGSPPLSSRRRPTRSTRTLSVGTSSSRTRGVQTHASGAASYLTDAFVEEDFAFFGRELGGQKALKPRWKRVVAHANGSIGELVGKKYVERHFLASAKDAAKRLVACVTRAVEERLRDLRVDVGRDAPAGAREDARVRSEDRVPGRVDRLRGSGADEPSAPSTPTRSRRIASSFGAS